MTKTSRGYTSIGSLLMVGLLALGIALWLKSSTPATQQAFANGVGALFAFLLMQPCIFVGARVAMKTNRPLRTRLALGSAIVVCGCGVAFLLAQGLTIALVQLSAAA